MSLPYRKPSVAFGGAFWLALFAALFVSSMAYQQHRATNKYKDHRAEYCATLVTVPEQQKTCIEERTNADDYLDWRYELFSWPNGITAWAIIFTGFAIFWQSSETRKAAVASEISAKEMRRQNRNMIAKERARLTLSLVPTAPGVKKDVWEMSFCIENFGQTRAFDANLVAAYRITDTQTQPAGHTQFVYIPPTIKPDEPVTVWGFAWPDGGEGSYSLTDVKAKNAFVHLYGQLRYRDVFSNRSRNRVVNFYYRWLVSINEIDVDGDNGVEWITEDHSTWVAIVNEST